MILAYAHGADLVVALALLTISAFLGLTHRRNQQRDAVELRPRPRPTEPRSHVGPLYLPDDEDPA